MPLCFYLFIRIYEEEYTIDLRNASLMTADVDIEFLDDLEEFQIDKTAMRLEVCKLDFRLYPQSDELTKMLLLIKINVFTNICDSLEIETS